MKTRFSFKNHFSSTFFIYIAAIVVTSIVCSYSVLLKTRPKDYETFSFFSEINFVQEGVFKDQMLRELPEDILINIYTIETKEDVFNTYFSAYGLNSDICILSKTTLDKFQTIQFLDLRNTIWDLPDNYHFSEEYSIGVRCHPKGSDKLNNVLSFGDDDYYFVVIRNSVHLNGLVNNSKTDQVNRVLKYLMNYE